MNDQHSFAPRTYRVRWRFGLGLASAGVVGLLAMTPLVAKAKEPAVVIDYVVQEGDNCTSLARRFWGARNKYSVLHEYNPNMGPTPHRLEPGQVLRIPFFAEATGPEAEVTAKHREVRAREAKEQDWALASLGLDLYRGWRVNTLERSMAELTFRDKSKVHLRQNTLVIIYGATSSEARKGSTTARLDKGTLRSRLGELAGLKVDMPAAQADLSTGRALVAVDDSGTSRVSNHGGKGVALRSSGKSRKIQVKRGFGSKVLRGKAPTKPKPLPPTPAWTSGQTHRFVGIDGFSGTLRGEWAKVDKAAAYYIEIARDLDGGDVVAAMRVPSKITKFEAHGLPPGDYFAFVAAVDDDEFESIPSAVHAMELLGSKLDGPAGTKPVWPDGQDTLDESTARVPRVLPGAVVDAPQGLKCAHGSGTPNAKVTLHEPGLAQVDCVDAEGRAVPGFAVDVVDVRVAAGDEATKVVLPRGKETTVEIVVDSSIELPLIAPRAQKGLLVRSVVPTSRNTWDVVLVAEGALPDAGFLEFGLKGDPAGPVLASVPYNVGDVAVREGSEPRVAIKERHMVEMGVGGGATFYSPSHQLYDSNTSERRAFQTASGTIDLRAGYYPIRWVGMEVEGAAIPTATADRNRGTTYMFGGQLVGQLPYRVTPFVAAGGGLVGVSSPTSTLGNDVDGAFQFGGGLKIFATKNIAIRLGVRDTLMPRTGSGLSHNLQITGGLSIVLRRQSATRRR